MKSFALAISLVPLLYALVPFAQADPLAENQARIGDIQGDVGLLSQGAPEWIEPHEGLPLESGDRIRTGEDGYAELLMAENALWTLEPETEVVIEHTEGSSGRLDLVSGSLLGRVDSARTAGVTQRWEFNTPVSVAAVRGTEFALRFTKEEGSRLGVFEGTVELEPAETAAGLAPPTPVNAGQEALVARGKPIKTQAKFSPVIQALYGRRTNLEHRQLEIQNTWSPFTTTTRSEARKRFVAAPLKRSHIRRPSPRQRRSKLTGFAHP